MLTTRLTVELGLQHPIVPAGMANIARAKKRTARLAHHGGQSVEPIREVLPAGRVVERIPAEAGTILRARLGGLLG